MAGSKKYDCEDYKPLAVVGYIDSNFACDLKDRKSVAEYRFFMGRVMTTWCSKRQRTASTSTFEAEYVAMSHGAKEGVWIGRLLNKLMLENAVRAMNLLGDNETSLTLTSDRESRNRTKHISVIHHHIRGPGR